MTKAMKTKVDDLERRVLAVTGKNLPGYVSFLTLEELQEWDGGKYLPGVRIKAYIGISPDDWDGEK